MAGQCHAIFFGPIFSFVDRSGFREVFQERNDAFSGRRIYRHQTDACCVPLVLFVLGPHIRLNEDGVILTGDARTAADCATVSAAVTHGEVDEVRL